MVTHVSVSGMRVRELRTEKGMHRLSWTEIVKFQGLITTAVASCCKSLSKNFHNVRKTETEGKHTSLSSPIPMYVRCRVNLKLCPPSFPVFSLLQVSRRDVCSAEFSDGRVRSSYQY